MVCIPCFAAPVILFIWYKFLYPIFRPILERYFGDRFALPADPDHCPICPVGSKGKCDQAVAEGSSTEDSKQDQPFEGSTKEEAVVDKPDQAKKED